MMCPEISIEILAQVEMEESSKTIIGRDYVQQRYPVYDQRQQYHGSGNKRGGYWNANQQNGNQGNGQPRRSKKP
jgi:hypothetical protein